MRALCGVVALCIAACSSPVSRVLDTQESECLDCQSAAGLKRCEDGLDNDEDWLFDCEDPDCAAFPGCNVVLAADENTIELCSDGYDNDGNGFVDCQDWDCQPTAACKPETPEPENADARCYDMLDNDHDGLLDCRDPDCLGPGVTVCEGSDATCADGLDNDGNGYTDCGDFSCSQSDDVSICP